MVRQLIYIVTCWLITNDSLAGGRLEIVTDTVAPDYRQAVDLCLFHRYREAEQLLKQIIRQPTHPNRDAASALLLEEVYLWRGLYQSYVLFADSTRQQPSNLTFAKRMVEQPVLRMALPTDSTVLPFELKKKGHIVIKVLINGKLRKFQVDTGAQRTLISNKLADELHLTQLLSTTVVNSLGQSLPATLTWLNTVQISSLQVANLPVFVQSLWGFGVDGILGWDVLRHFCFTVDYQTKTVTLRTPVLNNEIVKNLLGGSRPLMVFHSLTGNPLILFFDSGSNEKVCLSPNGLTKIGPYSPGQALSFQLGFGGKMRIRREKTAKQIQMAMNDRRFSLKKAVINQANEWISGVIVDGLVGSGQFRKGRLTVDFLNNHFDYYE